jgi:hypothetical protein
MHRGTNTKMNERRTRLDQLRGEAQIAFALDALRGIVVLNGGALIALLTFLGQAWSKNENQAIIVAMGLRKGLVCFVLGALAGIVAQGLAYLAQQHFVEDKRLSGCRLRIACIAMSLGGMSFFAFGCFASVAAMIDR